MSTQGPYSVNDHNLQLYTFNTELHARLEGVNDASILPVRKTDGSIYKVSWDRISTLSGPNKYCLVPGLPELGREKLNLELCAYQIYRITEEMRIGKRSCSVPRGLVHYRIEERPRRVP